ncbi:hypothetical protein [uncultured Microbacterium sp.]|nr:hypothetical protein [uncultured Microbacterium sp.]
MTNAQQYTITITGQANPELIPGLVEDAMKLADENGTVTVHVGAFDDF